MRVRKGRGGGVGSNAYFSRPTQLIRMPTTRSRTKDTKDGPAETINTKVSGKVNLIFYKLNLFPIFLVDKVKKKKKGKIVICRIMMNFTITAAGVTQCEFSINMLNSFNSESRCATSFIS